MCCTSICPSWSALHLHHYRAHCRKALIEVTFIFTVQSGGVWAAHFNFLNAGSNDGHYSLVCTEAVVPSWWQLRCLRLRASTCTCMWALLVQAFCLGVLRVPAVRCRLPFMGTDDVVLSQLPCPAGSHVRALREGFFPGQGATNAPAPSQAAREPEGQGRRQPFQLVRGFALPQGHRRNLVAGSWGHVPVGCSVQSGGDWAAHFNRRASGSNDGGHSPVCSGPAATIVEETQSDSGVKQCGNINDCGPSQCGNF